MAKKIPICTTSIKTQVRSAIQSKVPRKQRLYRLPDDIAFDVSLEVDDKLYGLVETDDKLANAIFAGVSKEFKEAQKEIADIFIEAEKAAKKLKKQHPPKKARSLITAKKGPIRTDVLSILQSHSNAMVNTANAEIDKMLKVRKDRTKYVRKAVVKVTLSTVGVVTASVGTGLAAASGGYALGVAIYGLVKSMVGLGKQIYNLAIDIDKAEKKLSTDLQAVRKAYLQAGKKEVAGKEIGKSVIERVLTYEMKSISGCEKELDLFVGKLRGIDVKARDYGKKLHQILDKQSELDKLIDKKISMQEADGQYVSKRLPKLKKTMQKLVKSTTSQITAMEKLYKRIALGNRKEPIYRNALTQLKAKKPGWVKYVEMATALIDISLDISTLQNEVGDIVLFVGNIVSELSDIANEET